MFDEHTIAKAIKQAVVEAVQLSHQTAPSGLLTQTQAADYLGLSTRTLEGWRFRGIGPDFTKIGGRVRYRHKNIEAWLDAQTRDLEPFASEGGCK